jgi:hypothetical protein
MDHHPWLSHEVLMPGSLGYQLQQLWQKLASPCLSLPCALST